MNKNHTVSVFLSHSSEDKSLVRKIGNDLMRYGAKVWIDEAEIKIGDSLIDKISEGIHEADYLAVSLSRASVKSEWVKRELNIALNREISGHRIKVVPLLLKQCDLPLFLIDKKYINLSGTYNYIDGIQALAKDLNLLGKEDDDSFMRQLVFTT
ncbi:toll/interleukin-1 receptor domain-containing protein [Pseudodesulfovibrio sediminis]|uniref:TIR domain-containing protein n=1 Tax=Pseudodesulfovibrio sediminis TaxID=2810563 RepID=A0ABM7P6C6_9BACT|nr:toll/interleukin-1 receptor domain-containing protein [Pseudodesulfovibrio sediminis]BCS89103.1 hypothetical protein PSDVSF_23450 [Pseudodesulfovibrio sediminis]